MEAHSSEPATEPVRFRAGKKRKAYRQRVQEDDAAVVETIQSPPTASASEPSDEFARKASSDRAQDEGESVAAALKLRNARRARLGGVAFRNTNRPDDDMNNERALIPHDADYTSNNEPIMKGVADRFTHQTGRLTDLNDKHMMDYIESRLYNRAGGNSSQNTLSATTSDPARQPSATTTNHESGRAVMQGQLMEINLDDHSTRSENAIQADSATDGGPRAKKPRLRRDGKPWRPRNRRDSDALKRDQIVDEILHETRLDLYEPTPEQNSRTVVADQDGAADARLAEEFRQQFLEDVAERQLRKKKATNQTTRAGTEEVLKGPKLGGSRNARAQMRDLLLKKEKEGKK
ncbi:hypothetical protein FOQG_09603 [Fusarium oxysporum f. sp. raphani 54005]|uniref:mRNA splicing factor RNA helicase n=2 Tax=Fusarium oxysporum f. sp. raphani TaxID=96318 RepID=X0CWJ9_FUSOX|nr:hypothetical protein FOQG_09603 [Fusarium oxysporum f. sp. raphani 54005]KAG7438206.1 hypothetical protein Forpi1262_v000902 [Fusarium oxysporum f. sp. raphani]KAJ4059814.1 hypothetical protein NW758_000380 [Fusarium oxysporum]KAJ4061261.1 hypothetical protein NW753_005504 [Fusarium oxysporum]KAJ4063472.1 hypothetical protein NW763_003744 [Fusarium oxysporum]